MKQCTNKDIENMSASIQGNDYDEGEDTENIDYDNNNGTRLVRNKLVPKRSQSASISRSNNTSGSSTRQSATTRPKTRKMSEDEVKYGDESNGQITTIKKYKETHQSSDEDVGVQQLARKKMNNKRSSSAIVGGRGRNVKSPDRARNPVIGKYVGRELNAMHQDVGERTKALETMFKNPSISLSTTESSSRSTFKHT